MVALQVAKNKGTDQTMGCTGWSTPLFFAWNKVRNFHQVAHFIGEKHKTDFICGNYRK